MTDKKKKTPPAKQPGKIPKIPVLYRPIPRTVGITPTITDKIDPLTGKRTTSYGIEIRDEMSRVRAAVKRLPDYMKLLSPGWHYETGVPDMITGKRRGKEEAGFSPTEKKATMPVGSSKVSASGLVFDRAKSVPHEAAHIADRRLKELYVLHGGTFGAKTMVDFSEHPVFAKSYADDLKKIPNDSNKRWDMDLGHYLPREKGGNHDADLDYWTPRSETFAETSSIVIQKGKSLRDKLNRTYSSDFKKLFPSMYKVTKKLHAELAILAKKYPDQATFDAAVGKYLVSMPDDPGAFLKSSVVQKSLSPKL